MKNCICPFCASLNRNLILEETDGWFECEVCGRDVPAAAAPTLGNAA